MGVEGGRDGGVGCLGAELDRIVGPNARERDILAVGAARDRQVPCAAQGNTALLKYMRRSIGGPSPAPGRVHERVEEAPRNTSYGYSANGGRSRRWIHRHWLRRAPWL